MVKNFIRYAAMAIVGLAFSASLTVAAVTRPLPDTFVLEQPLLTELARQFHAETPYMVNFGFDLDTLDGDAIANLDIQAQWILAHPQVRFSVYGHTDKVGPLDYNMDLGLRRAQTVVAYLVSKGVEAHRLEALVSFGEDLPLINTSAPERANRRATTFVAGFIEEGEDLVARNSNDRGNPITPDPNDDDPICVEGVDCPGDPGDCTEGVDCPGDPGDCTEGVDCPGDPGDCTEGVDCPGDPGDCTEGVDCPGDPGDCTEGVDCPGDPGDCTEGVDCPGDPGDCTQGVDCPGDPRGNPGNGPKEGHNDAGIGNGSEEGPDPGNSEAHNRGGDEETFNPGKRRSSPGSSGKGRGSSSGKARR